jgi:DNA-3-methyladenine glycosylase II
LKTDSFELTTRPPYRLDFTVWVLRRQPHNAVDLWDGATYRRALVVDGRPLAVAVRQVSIGTRPRLSVEVSGQTIETETLAHLRDILRAMLGLDVDLSGFYALAARERKLAPLAESFRGVRPPRFPSLFEALVCGVSCQQITLALGIHLLNRLAREYGATADGEAHAFPEPGAIEQAEPAALRALGYSLNKARALRAAARAAAAGGLDPVALALLDDSAAIARLRSLRGVGPWTAEYVLLRGLGRIGIFPSADSGAIKGLARVLALRRPLSAPRADRLLQRFSPYAGLVYFHLLLARLAARQVLH